MRSTGLSAAEKSAVTAACQELIDNFLKPSFLSAIRPTQFNYPVDILGKWLGTKYRFVQRYRSGFPECSASIWMGRRGNLDGESVSRRSNDCRADCRAQEFC
jgi:hypothetical protein